MLTKAENEALTSVDGGKPMGELVRRYWMPATVASKAPAPNGAPVRVRLVGENFVLWRDQDGRLAFFDENCMHRGASLALGRCEGDGLRCLYHGWKYAADGTILETPNYRKATVREKLRAPAYPVREAGGLVWVYLGPAAKEPPFPHYRFFDFPPGELPFYHATFGCNFVQSMEGTIDPSHRLILHKDSLGPSYSHSVDTVGGGSAALVAGVTATSFFSDDAAPECIVEDTEFGCHGVAMLDAVADGKPTKYARVHTWVMPFLAMPTSVDFVFSVPVDNETTAFYLIHATAASKEVREKYLDEQGGPAAHYNADGHYMRSAGDRWGQDRERMTEAFTGIEGVVPEDIAMTVSMGPVYDRSRENLVPADQLVIRMRRRMLQAARDLQTGVEPRILKPEETINLGGDGALLSDPTRWQELLVPGNMPFRIIRREAATADS